MTPACAVGRGLGIVFVLDIDSGLRVFQSEMAAAPRCDWLNPLVVIEPVDLTDQTGAEAWRVRRAVWRCRTKAEDFAAVFVRALGPQSADTPGVVVSPAQDDLGTRFQ